MVSNFRYGWSSKSMDNDLTYCLFKIDLFHRNVFLHVADWCWGAPLWDSPPRGAANENVKLQPGPV